MSDPPSPPRRPDSDLAADRTAADRSDPAAPPRRRGLALVPRLKDQGFAPELVARRRAWVEQHTGARLDQVGAFAFDSEQMRGNVENPIGAAQVPIGVAGPLVVRGEHADGTFYVPLATTEGAMVRSYERGMVALTHAGGAEARVWLDENRVCPVFHLSSVAAARQFGDDLAAALPQLRAAAEATTRHGRLLRVEPHPQGRAVTVSFCYSTGDAHGMNMIVSATDAACRWVAAHLLDAAGGAITYQLFTGMSSEKRSSGSLLAGGKGKKVTAGALLPKNVVETVLGTSPAAIAEMWRTTVLGHLQAGSIGYNGQYANGLAALYIACGQDVANIVNAAVGWTTFEVTGDGALYASVTLPALTVATVGGGTALATADECLAMLGCRGAGKARKLAEITAATLLAGELSMGAAIATGELVAGHERYGRNRPEPPRPDVEPGAADPADGSDDE